MSKTWIVTTTTKVITEYTVEGETELEATDNFWEGWSSSKKDIYSDEEMVEIKEAK